MDKAAPCPWTDEDPSFPEMCKLATQRGAEMLQDTAREHAFDAKIARMHYLDHQVARVQKYSNTLASFLIKGAMSDKLLRTHRREHQGRFQRG
ncbi:MAG: hypothetical protein LH632_19145 [Rhodoferax sp.]|nr:hypothetical protein [Rhodoferax sp.]